MTTRDYIFLGVAELVALVFIVRLWLKRRHKHWVVRILWSLILLIPVLGIIAYGFLRTNPSEHSYNNFPNSTDVDPGHGH